MKILLTGAQGQVGWELQRSLALLGPVHAVGRATLDLSDAAAIRRLVRAVRPTVVVNAAAYTAVDNAENDEALAYCINAEAPGVLAAEAARLGAGLVHYSTDYVFDGSQPAAYTEDDVPNPRSAYGRTKLAGEQAVMANTSQYVVLRTTWVYAPRGRNFPLTMLKLGRERDHLRVVADQLGAPTPARLIADATALILQQITAPGSTEKASWAQAGLYHLSCGGSASWYDFARRVLAWQAAQTGRAGPTIEAITTAQYPTPATRPHNSVLNNQRLRDTFGLVLPHWARAFELCFEDIHAAV